MPKDLGAEQGDVDGPLECSLALERVAAEARWGNSRLRTTQQTQKDFQTNSAAECNWQTSLVP